MASGYFPGWVGLGGGGGGWVKSNNSANSARLSYASQLELSFAKIALMDDDRNVRCDCKMVA